MSAASLTEREVATWVRVCALDALFPDRGAAALVDGRQVALFRLAGEPDVVRAIGHRDPYSGANVMARGLVGTVGDVPVVVSPMHKQRFRFDDGTAVEDPAVSVGVWATRVVDGVVEVAATPLLEPRPSSLEPLSSLELVETTPVGVSTGSTVGSSAAPPAP
ncbi:nitrite reductase small subunit NirD [Mumia sp. ZJ430]|uniref:nitrite reductase small subunit NirD n=1 Tax=Mumia sp. ZJ430 TaxID=2708083 RepID=UPI001FB9C23E|nr:nitrite reductase small subunit NirD [Mumia sp. ZJ430]